ncbi:MAG: hypothetical protein COA80_19375 [Leeuwenhoekiella sp.]|nr:MAG: hypothetical protein COA80_19375 [Leeuwenhoekiella sp.]
MTQVIKKRRSQEERSYEMQQRILNAAFELLRERGYPKFSTIEVAKRAKVSRGALVHHFASKAVLVESAIEHVFNRSLVAGLERVAKLNSTKDPIGAVLEEALDFYFSDFFYVGLEMLISGTKDEDLKDKFSRVVHNYRQPMEEEWLKVLCDNGLPVEIAEELMWLTVNIVRGAAIRALWRNEPERINKCLNTWRNMVACYTSVKLVPSRN